MQTLQEIILHFVYRLQRTSRLFASHFDGKWGRFFVQEGSVGIVSAIVGLATSEPNLDLESLEHAIYSGVIGISLYTIVVFLGSYVRSGSSLYFEQRKKAGKFNWDDIKIQKTEIRDKRNFRAYGIKMKNGKVYDLRKIIAQIQYLEIDGTPDVQNRQLLQTQRGRRLGWLWNDHRIDVTEQSLDKNGGEAVIDLFRVMPNQISFFEYSEDKNKFIPRDINIEKFVNGEILFLASFNPIEPEWIPIENIYRFTIVVNPNGKPKMIFEKGRLYKPPEVEP